MNAIRIHKFLDSESLNLPELRSMLGRHVEIIVLDLARSDDAEANNERALDARRRALHGTLIKDEDPLGPAVASEDWNVFKSEAWDKP